MEHIQHLIQQISKIVDEEKIQQEEKRKRGENFNIFGVLGLSRSEVRLHSAFLAELLNPNGNHGLGAKFLKAFVEDVLPKDENFMFDVDSAKPYVEYHIGEINENYTEGGRIDILIQDKKRHSIIIENKIDAIDQKNQLLRYYNFITKDEGLTEDKFILLYLTLDGTKPSEDSLGKNIIVKYKCISYRENILNWLGRCIEIAALHPSIREILQQYILNLKEILSIMEKTNDDNFFNILTAYDNAETTLTILERSSDIQTRIRENFISQIKNLSESYGFIFYCDEGVKTACYNNWVHICDPNYKDIEFRIGVKRHTNDDGYRMCFVTSRQTLSTNYRFWDNDNPLEEFPFGWTYLWGEDGKNGRWWRWDDIGTLKDMVNGKMLHFIKGQLQRIKDENVFEKMNELLA